MKAIVATAVAHSVPHSRESLGITTLDYILQICGWVSGSAKVWCLQMGEMQNGARGRIVVKAGTTTYV